MQEIRHTAGQVRYLYGTPTRILEFRALPTATTTIETLIVHVPACNGDQCAAHGWDCDAETPGDTITLAWWAGDDAGIWAGLAAYAVAQDINSIPQPPVEPSHEQRALIGRLRAIADRMTNNSGDFA
ncbi:hypothetical protein [Micromonospora carbonacea]|uniref:Uncharacterized protein n=1 Tax=Micromonospora carbonacea TaxID=47853 RepID=A0A1C5AAL2_9ACTN|nr:hypothetical protein [Micromonospora carbonacea]SCF42272.1 hypothetical protein GA0070563_11259 [Micromonospora carbonacea]